MSLDCIAHMMINVKLTFSTSQVYSWAFVLLGVPLGRTRNACQERLSSAI